MSNDIDISVSTPEAAAQLKEDFEELIARVNGDLMSHAMTPTDPISVEAAIDFAHQRIDHHLSIFAGDNQPLQSIVPDIKKRFRESIEEQARIAAGGR